MIYLLERIVVSCLKIYLWCFNSGFLVDYIAYVSASLCYHAGWPAKGDYHPTLAFLF